MDVVFDITIAGATTGILMNTSAVEVKMVTKMTASSPIDWSLARSIA